MSPEDPRHGSEAGHEQHIRDDEDPCAPCYDAKLRAARRRTKRKTMGYQYTVPAGPVRERIMVWRDAGASFGAIADHTGIDDVRVWEVVHGVRTRVYTRTATPVLRAKGWPVTPLGITRRVQALTRLGYTLPVIAAASGVHHDTVMDIRQEPSAFLARKVRDRLLAAYDELSMRMPSPTVKQEKAGVTRARNYADARGWPAPLAWDDIDDPTEDPRPLVERRAHNGTSNRPAVVDDFDFLVSCGESEDHALKRIGVTYETVRDYRSALARKKASMATSPTRPDCICSDAEVQILRELVEQGHNQREVSHLLWGDPSRASPATTLAFTGRWTRLWIRRSYQAAFPWLRLPGGGRA